MHHKSAPLSLLRLVIWTDSALIKHDTAQRPTFTQRHKADRPISPDDRVSRSHRGIDIGFKAITKAAALEVIQ